MVTAIITIYIQNVVSEMILTSSFSGPESESEALPLSSEEASLFLSRGMVNLQHMSVLGSGKLATEMTCIIYFCDHLGFWLRK